jgi:hypothetical protein
LGIIGVKRCNENTFSLNMHFRIKYYSNSPP